MNLPIDLKTRIYHHIGDVQKHLGELPADEQREILQSLETHIHDALESRSNGQPDPELLEAILAEMDPPESYGPRSESGNPVNRTPMKKRKKPTGCVIAILALVSIPLILTAAYQLSRSESPASGELAINNYLERLPILESSELGRPLTPEYQSLFNGRITIQAFEQGVVCSDKNGTIKRIRFSDTINRQFASGDIGHHFRHSGGEQAFGIPFFGEIPLDEDRYRMHIFTSSIMLWERSTQIIQVAHYKDEFRDDLNE